MKPHSSTVSPLSVLAALLLGALPFSAQAAHSDDFTVWDAQRNIIEYVQISEADEIRNGPDFVYTLTTAIDPSQFGNFTSLYDDPANPLTSIGDVFGIAQVGGSLMLAFSSDTDTALPFGGVLVGAHNFWEGSQAAFDATMYLATNLQAAGWTAAFRSDNALNNIPEPASLGLLAFGAFGLLASRRRKIPAA